MRKWLEDVGLANTHFEKAKSIKDSVAYCSKAESRKHGPYRSAKAPKDGAAVQGARKDLELAIDALKKGGSMREVAQTYSEVFVRNHRGLNALAALVAPAEPRPNMDTICLYGPAGTGKTTLAAEICESLFPGKVPYYKPSGPWWCGYADQEAMILDDYAGKGVAIQEVKNVLDKTPCTVQPKGGHAHLRTEIAIITSNTDPREWYPEAKPEDIKAVLRRMLIWRVPDNLWGSPERVGLKEALKTEILAAYAAKDPVHPRRGADGLERHHPAFVHPIEPFAQDRVLPRIAERDPPHNPPEHIILEDD